MLIALKLALRQFIKTPVFTAAAVVTLAICLGANLTIYSVVDAILVRSLPFPQPDRLVSVFNSYPGAGAPRSAASIPNYYDRRGGAIKAFSSVSACQGGSVIVGGDGSPSRVETERVTPEFFATLGVALAKGRMFSDDNLLYGADEVAVLTDEFWRAHFDADPNVVGRKFLNDGLSITVIGVLPKGFQFLSSRALFYRPLSHSKEDREAKNRHSNNMQMVARLAPGITLAQAQAQMDTFNALQLKDDPIAPLVKNAGYHTTVKFLQEDFVRDAKPTLVLLQAGALLLLVIGGVNLVDLLLIRATGRVKEVAVRQALGAGRRHVALNVVAETTLLAVAGGLCGLLLGAFGVDLIRALGANQLPLGAQVSLDARVAVASAVAVMAVSLMLAGPIIWFHLHSDIGRGLQADSRGGDRKQGREPAPPGIHRGPGGARLCPALGRGPAWREPQARPRDPDRLPYGERAHGKHLAAVEELQGRGRPRCLCAAAPSRHPRPARGLAGCGQQRPAVQRFGQRQRRGGRGLQAAARRIPPNPRPVRRDRGLLAGDEDTAPARAPAG
jgi:predicted permease